MSRYVQILCLKVRFHFAVDDLYAQPSRPVAGTERVAGKHFSPAAFMVAERRVY